MTYKEVYDLHIQLLHFCEKNEIYQGSYQKQISHYKKQFFLTEDVVRKIFVLTRRVVYPMFVSSLHSTARFLDRYFF